MVSYRFGRLALTYLAYWSAILLNKLAQFIGIQAKKSFDQIRDRADAYRKARLEAKAALEDQSEATADEKALVKAAGATEASMIQAEQATDQEPLEDAAKEAEEEDPAESDADEPEKTVISVDALRKQKDFFEPAPVIEKAVSAPESSKPKFKIDKKRGKWKLPEINFLRKVTRIETAIDRDRLESRASILTDKLGEFGICGTGRRSFDGAVVEVGADPRSFARKSRGRDRDSFREP
ncbi:MAG: hypothetical protein EBX52_11515 [Proteobacteria bacterium]|nr:hypothetical protein [Pseudomonadota bacterium]